MVKKIVVATDGSDYSHRALKAAVDAAGCYQAEIILLFVFTQPRSYGTFSGLQSVKFSDTQIDEISKKIFSVTLKDVDTKGIPITKKVRVGQPAESILEEIEESNIDLVVMGSRGHGQVSGLVTGSVTQKVLGLAPCPVMVVK